jgi:Mg-chelatase subunit ChlD
MKSKLLGIALFIVTVGAVVYYPQLKAKNIPVNPPVNHHITASQNPKIDVVFVLDTTGSMSGLIQTAKEKIWSTGCLSRSWRSVRNQIGRSFRGSRFRLRNPDGLRSGRRW